jgi:hypothetical protein
MRCPLCLNEDALDILDTRTIDGKRIAVHTCTIIGCEAVGTRKELEVASQAIVDDRYAYFHCPTLQIGLFYRDSYTPFKSDEFHDSYRVDVPRLGIAVDIEFQGLGEQGFLKLNTKQRTQTETIFPVNLWNNNRILDPKPSRTVTQLMSHEWSLIATAWERRATT